jgi:hypothetical protein
LVTAFVVFPTASSGSVIPRTASGRSAVERHDEARHGQLGHHGDADAVQALARRVVGADDARGDDDHRQRRRLHPDRETRDDVRRVTGL